MKNIFLLIFAFALGTPAAAEPVTTATFDAALAAAVGGETLELAPGDYGALDIRNRMFPSDVTIISADPANPAIIGRFRIEDSSHFVFDGILFDYVNVETDYPWVKPFTVFDSSSITIRNSVFDGDEVPSESGVGEYGTGYGLWVQTSDNIVVESNEFFDFFKAFVVLKSSNITFNANDVHTIAGDIINYVSVDGGLIEGNWLHDFKIDPAGGNHPDMIQMWTSPTGIVIQNVVIRGNFLDAGTGNWTQSIFMRNELSPFINLLIEDNVIYNDHSHGITVGITDGLVVRNNTLLRDPHVISPYGAGPRISLGAPSVNVILEGNITGDVWNWVVMIDQPGWTVGNNLLLDYDPASLDYYVPLFVDPLAVNATLADLRAVSGGLVETMGVGAEMTRADIAMAAGPYATVPVPDPEPEPVIAPVVQDALDALQTQIEANATTTATLTVWLNVLQAQIGANTTAVATNAGALGNLQVQIGANTALIGSLAADLAVVQPQIDTLQGGLMILEGAHDALVADVDARFTASQGEITDNSTATALLAALLAEVETALDAVETEAVRAHTRIDVVEALVDALDARVSTAEGRIAAGAAGLGN